MLFFNRAFVNYTTAGYSERTTGIAAKCFPVDFKIGGEHSARAKRLTDTNRETNMPAFIKDTTNNEAKEEGCNALPGQGRCGNQHRILRQGNCRHS